MVLLVYYYEPCQLLYYLVHLSKILIRHSRAAEFNDKNLYNCSWYQAILSGPEISNCIHFIIKELPTCLPNNGHRTLIHRSSFPQMSPLRGDGKVDTIIRVSLIPVARGWVVGWERSGQTTWLFGQSGFASDIPPLPTQCGTPASPVPEPNNAHARHSHAEMEDASLLPCWSFFAGLCTILADRIFGKLGADVTCKVTVRRCRSQLQEAGP